MTLTITEQQEKLDAQMEDVLDNINDMCNALIEEINEIHDGHRYYNFELHEHRSFDLLNSYYEFRSDECNLYFTIYVNDTGVVIDNINDDYTTARIEDLVEGIRKSNTVAQLDFVISYYHKLTHKKLAVIHEENEQQHLIDVINRSTKVNY